MFVGSFRLLFYIESSMLKLFPCLIKCNAMKTYEREGTVPPVLNISTRCRSVTSFKHPAVLPRGRRLEHQLNGRLYESHTRSGNFEEEKISFLILA